MKIMEAEVKNTIQKSRKISVKVVLETLDLTNIIKIISEEVVIQKSSRGMLQVVSTDEGE